MLTFKEYCKLEELSDIKKHIELKIKKFQRKQNALKRADYAINTQNKEQQEEMKLSIANS